MVSQPRRPCPEFPVFRVKCTKQSNYHQIQRLCRTICPASLPPVICKYHGNCMQCSLPAPRIWSQYPIFQRLSPSAPPAIDVTNTVSTPQIMLLVDSVYTNQRNIGAKPGNQTPQTMFLVIGPSLEYILTGVPHLILSAGGCHERLAYSESDILVEVLMGCESQFHPQSDTQPQT
jgi:hypothetical protein